MVKITVPKGNDNLLFITLDNKNYYLRLSYNAEKDYWSLGVYDGAMKPIVARMKLVPNFPINRYFARTEMPQGVFCALTSQEKIGEESFWSGEAELYYVPYVDFPSEVRIYAK